MTIGLLSMQRVKNYGSFWQAYCLKKLIEKQQNVVEFIDIIPGEEATRTVFKRSFSFSKIQRIPYYIFQRKKHKVFTKFQKNMLGCWDEPNYQENYDGIIIGSDEVFNFVQDSPWGFSPQLYGAMDNSNINSYAACFGYTTLKDIEDKGVRMSIVSALSNLNNISVRDVHSAEIIRHLTGVEPELHFDPVLVGDLPLDRIPSIDEGRYILIYSYDFRFSDEDMIRQIRKIAERKKCKIYSVGFYQSWCDKNIVDTPLNLLGYFKHAQYIVTDTFHGTIFSVRFHKPFVTVIRDSNRFKLQDLLMRMNLEYRIVFGQVDLSHILYEDIDYDTFEHFRQKERARTDDYIRQCVWRSF